MKTIMKKLLICISLCLMTSMVYSQMNYTIEGGYALTANFSPTPSLRQPMHGAQAGFAVDYRFRSLPLLGIKTGLGYRFSYSVSDFQMEVPYANLSTYNDHYEVMEHTIFLPVRLSVNFDINDWTLKLLTGPQISYHFGKSIYYSEDLTGARYGEGTTNLGNVYIPFDCTWGIGFGAQYKHLYLEAMFDLGVFNRTRSNHPSYDMNTFSSRVFTLTIGYVF